MSDTALNDFQKNINDCRSGGIIFRHNRLHDNWGRALLNHIIEEYLEKFEDD